MVSTVNSAASHTLAALATQPRIGDLDLQFSTGWNETTDFQKGLFSKQWGSTSWEDAILQGPHLYVSTPLYKQPNETMRHFQDWTSTDLETLSASAEPVTQYKPAGDRATYDRLYTHWNSSSARDHYRIAWRTQVPLTGERTLTPSIIPPGSAHVDGLYSGCSPQHHEDLLVLASGTLSSILVDFYARSRGFSHIRSSAANSLPTVSPASPLALRVQYRTLRLNCLTDAYAHLWTECWDESF